MKRLLETIEWYIVISLTVVFMAIDVTLGMIFLVTGMFTLRTQENCNRNNK